ncbi:hypothetical protein ACIBF7_38685 [Nonomuraea sp. NPDC050478]|uniref:hypothetical protein n=1 Tax=Nonomuraea sp. NPDC050478 TaxID=3364365 RepID=UPI00378A2733
MFTAPRRTRVLAGAGVSLVLVLSQPLVPDGERQAVLGALVELVYAFHPNGGGHAVYEVASGSYTFAATT